MGHENGPMAHVHGPMSHSFACKNQDFDGLFEILMGHLEKMMNPGNLTINLTEVTEKNEHQI